MRHKILKIIGLVLIIFVLLFNLGKFIRTRLISIGLSKGKIVFHSLVDGDYEIYTMNINGTGLKQLTKNRETVTNSATDANPSFSSDGEKIVFTSWRQTDDQEIIRDQRGRAIGEGTSPNPTSDIYIMDSNGKNQTPLTYHSRISLDPKFSPDGKWIVFYKLTDGRRYTRIIDSKGLNQRIFNYGFYHFSPDGKRIYNTFESELSVLDLDRDTNKKLTNILSSEKVGDFQQLPREFIADFAISPDEKKIVLVVKDRSQDMRLYPETLIFYIMNINGSGVEEIYRFTDPTDASPIILRIRYSPDGRYVAFLSDFIRNSKLDKNIYLLNMENRKLTNLTEGEGIRQTRLRTIIDFDFTPDSQKIFFIADIWPKNMRRALFFHKLKGLAKYILFRIRMPIYDNKYTCTIDIDGSNYRRIAKLPDGSELGSFSDFIHWQE